ncbi:MAG: zinc metallopeptidase [Bacilli bacterium]|nr:zinc metallopeptidase [Bacilli bacterium]
MISYILLIISIILVVIGYLLLIVSYFTNKNKKKDITGADQVQKLLIDDSAINLIEDKEAYFSHYNIKRNIVKLKSKTYNGRDVFSLAVASFLSGYSLVKNNIFNYIAFIFKELKIFSFIPFITIIMSYLVSNSGDSKIAIVIFIVALVYLYLINSINTEAIDRVKLNDMDINKVMSIFNKISTIFFISILVQMLRLIVIILNI